MINIREDLQKYPHHIDPKTTHDNRYDELTYVSIQSKVNSSKEYEDVYFNELSKNGWVALKNVTDIFYLNKGRQFKYRLNGNSMSGAPEGTFRSGGWFVGKNDADTDPDNRDKYLLYKAFNGAVFSLQIKDIMEVYIKSQKKDVIVFKKPDPKSISDYPVYLQNSETGKNEVVYYAPDAYKQKRFMNSIKYKKANMTGLWNWSVVFNDDINDKTYF